MDDEENIRAVTKKMLGRLGFRTYCTENGEKAIEIYKEFKEKGEPFDIVILDLTNKLGMGGQSTMERLKEYDPNIVAIATSGYNSSDVMVNYSKYGFQDILAKPYKLMELKNVISNLVN